VRAARERNILAHAIRIAQRVVGGDMILLAVLLARSAWLPRRYDEKVALNHGRVADRMSEESDRS
jgi:hypothetical protein